MDNRLYNVKPPKCCEPDEKPSKCCELYEIVDNIVKENVKGKQNKLIAGLNITIKDDIISATVGGGFVQQQADWAQTDASAVDFIKNKPDLNVYVPKIDDDGHGMTIYSPGGITMFVADNQTGTFGAGGWYVTSPQGTFQTSGNTIYRGTIGIDQDSVIWEKTATQQIPAATTEANGLMSAEDKSKLNALPTDAELTQELAGKQNTIDDLSAIRSGAQAGATAYQKPNTGIPATDLASDVQTDLAAIDGIEAVIPEQASATNKLADKNFVNSSIATATATYRGSYNLVNDLSLTTSATHAQIAAALATKMAALSITPDNNDYCFVQIPTADDTPTEIARIDRYKCDGTAWAYEYSLNNSGYTAALWAAINSGITSGFVAKLSALPTNSELATLLNGKADTADLATVATSGSYNDLINKPTIQELATEKAVYALDNTNPDYPSMRDDFTHLDITSVFGAISIVSINPEGTEASLTEVTACDYPDAEAIIDNTTYVSYRYNNTYYLGLWVPFFVANVAQYGHNKTLGVLKFIATKKGLFKVHSTGITSAGVNPSNCVITVNGVIRASLRQDLVAVQVDAGDVVKIIPTVTSQNYVRIVGFVLEGVCGVSLFVNDAGYITNSVNNLINYYLKSETYTKQEVQQLIGAIQQFHYEVYPTLPQTGASNVLYLIGPKGTGTDKYEEYVYANNVFTKIGDTSIDLSGYVTTQALNTALTGKANTSEMSVVPGTGANADKTTITLKQGTSATVLTAHQDITGKEDITPIVQVASGTTAITAAVNTYYEVAGTVSSLTVTLPTPTANTEVTMVVVHLTVGASPTVVVTSVNEVVKFSAAYSVVANKEYELSCLYNGSKWIVSSMEVAV